MTQILQKPVELQKILTLSALLAEVRALTEVVPKLPDSVLKRATATLIDRFWLDDNDAYWPVNETTPTIDDY